MRSHFVRFGRFVLSALLVYSSLSWAAAGIALAEVPAYEPSNEVFTEPPVNPAFLPPGYATEFAQCPEAVEEAMEPPVEESVEGATARQVTLLRGELQQECRVYQQRLDQVVARQWWQVSEQFKDQHNTKEIAEDVDLVHGLLEYLPALAEGEGIHAKVVNGAGEAIPVEGEFTVEGGAEGGGEVGKEQIAELVSSVDAAGEGTTLALWTIAGLIVGSFIGYGLWKTTHRGV
jgi:hypothetical protein